MNIYAKRSDKVQFLNQHGYEFERDEATKHLTVGAVYTVERTSVGNFHTTVWLQEVPERGFNSVQFEDVCPECAGESAHRIGRGCDACGNTGQAQPPQQQPPQHEQDPTLAPCAGGCGKLIPHRTVGQRTWCADCVREGKHVSDWTPVQAWLTPGGQATRFRPQQAVRVTKEGDENHGRVGVVGLVHTDANRRYIVDFDPERQETVNGMRLQENCGWYPETELEPADAPPQQEQGLSPLAQALVNDDPMGALQALETDGVIGEIDPDDANLMLPICTAVAELLHHQEEQTMARVVGVLDEMDAEVLHTQRVSRDQAYLAASPYVGERNAIKRLRQRLGGEG